MFEKQIENSLTILKEADIILTKGMTEQELQAAEDGFGIKFPPDYREFLSRCLPLDHEYRINNWRNNFTNWRNTSDKYMENIKWKMYDWTIDGILYTVENLNGWLSSWGEQPNNIEERVELAKSQVKKQPLFIPIDSNRFIAINPCEAGNSVYSIHDIDVMCYGKDIWDYFKKDFIESNTLTRCASCFSPFSIKNAQNLLNIA